MKYARGGMTSLDYLMEIQRLENELKKYDWISVEDRLPEPMTDVLVTDGKSVDIDCFMRSSRQYFLHGRKNEWTHWMPLPEPPKE